MQQKIDEQLSADKTYAGPNFFLTRADGTRTVSPASWLGLDIQGRSVLWRTVYGTRIALLIMVCTSAISISIGTVLGLLAGYFGGWVDDLITWLYSTVSSIPWLLLVIAVAYVIQNAQTVNSDSRLAQVGAYLGGLPTVVLALGLTDWVSLCRLIRGEVIKLRDQDFVVAARAMGLSGRRVIARHILPNTFHIVVITFSLGSVGYVQAETVLAFLGLGITTKPSWGKMIDDSRLELLQGVWWQFAAATIAIVILCLALNVVGDALRDALDPKLHGVK
jgi:ABC-type dipeptide/oligopeptide/nickel transport system permease subunit